MRLSAPVTVSGTEYPKGSWYIKATPAASAAVATMAKELGVSFAGTTMATPGFGTAARIPRVGLWDTYGGSMPSGWTRWILEQFEFPFDRVYAPQLDKGDLNAKYDALVFVTGAIPGTAGGRGGRGGAGGAADEAIPYLPAEYRNQVGRVTAEKTLPKIREFIEKGGTVVAIGTSATNLAAYLKLPIESQLLENGAPLPRTKLYVPGSLLTARVDTSSSVGAGMSAHADFFFDDSPVFKWGPGEAPYVKLIASYDSKTPLRSGWAWGQNYLENGIAAAEIGLGKGRVILFGPEILQRAQPHGTFKLLFNSLYTSVQ